MQQKPHILVLREQGAAIDPALWADLSARGYALDVDTAPFRPAAERGNRPVDAIVLDLLCAGARATADGFRRHAEAVSDTLPGGRVPVLALCDGSQAQDLAADDAVDAIMSPPLSAAQIAHRVADLTRLGRLQVEMARRLETFSHYGLDAPEIARPAAVEEATLLIVGTGLRFAAIERALAGRAILIGAFTRDMAEEYLKSRGFDAVILDIATDEATDILQALRRNPRHFTLPVIVICGDGDIEDRKRLFEAGATEVVTEPIDTDEVGAHATALVLENRHREKLRAAYRQARHVATGDSLTGLFSRGFLLEHLDRMVRDHRQSDEPLTVCGMTIDNLGEINTEHGYAVGDRIIRQVGALIAQLVRGEDMAGRWGGGRFIVVHACSRPDEAEGAVRRIEGVINATRFSVEEGAPPIAARVWSRCVTPEPGESVETMVRRAFGA